MNLSAEALAQQAFRARKPALALRPPMGWNTWNSFRCYNINESTLIEVADSLVASGMLDSGYDTFVVDDCWQAHRRDDTGQLVAHPKRFPSGMRWLGEQLKSRGFKFGLYASPGRKTCAMIYDRYPGHDLGSYGHELEDARSFAAWGVDFLKYDWCEADEDQTGLRFPEAFERMATALNDSGREIVYSISEYGRSEPWTWAGNLGHMWRTTPDIEPSWASVLSIADQQSTISSYTQVGAWNDPDMLQVGNVGLNDIESATHFALWCFFAAPLMAGHDPRNMSPTTREILTNRNLIAINQDSLGEAAQRTVHGEIDVWVKPLVSGNATLIVNRTDSAADLRLTAGRLNWGGEQGTSIGLQASLIPLNGDSVVPLPAEGDFVIPAHGSMAIRSP